MCQIPSCHLCSAQSIIQPPSIAGMDGVVGLEALETGQNTKECGALSEWETTAAFTGSHPLCRGWGDGVRSALTLGSAIVVPSSPSVSLLFDQC